MKTIMLKANGDPFVTWDGTDYFIEGVKYTDDTDLLLDAMANVKPQDYYSLNAKSDSKEEFWKKYFNYQYSGGGLVLWQNPTEMWEHELTRRGELLCSVCNTPKYMHYKPRCPKCDKPTITTQHVINMIELCTHLEHLHNLEKHELWKWVTWVTDTFEFSNDSCIQLHDRFDNDTDKKYLKMIDDYSPISNTLYLISW